MINETFQVGDKVWFAKPNTLNDKIAEILTLEMIEKYSKGPFMVTDVCKAKATPPQAIKIINPGSEKIGDSWLLAWQFTKTEW